MPYAEECEAPYWVDPYVLLKPKFAPSTTCRSNAFNSLARGSILITIVCVLIRLLYGKGVYIFGTVVIAALYGPSLYATLFNSSYEPFVDEKKDVDVIGADLQQGQQHLALSGADPKGQSTKPTARNPFMNVLLDELKYNPKRPEAADITDPLVKTQLDDFFRVQWNSDPTDVFGRSQSQRQFYTVPSTSVPNDQESYQNWLYKIPGKTCKEGGRESCVGYNNSPLVSNWISN